MINSRKLWNWSENTVLHDLLTGIYSTEKIWIFRTQNIAKELITEGKEKTKTTVPVLLGQISQKHSHSFIGTNFTKNTVTVLQGQLSQKHCPGFIGTNFTKTLSRFYRDKFHKNPLSRFYRDTFQAKTP